MLINDPPLSPVQVIAVVIAGRHVSRPPDILITVSQAEYGNNRKWRAFHCHSPTKPQLELGVSISWNSPYNPQHFSTNNPILTMHPYYCRAEL